MCSPIIGAVIGAVGSIAGAAQRASVARAQAKAARNNALAERQRATFEARRERSRRQRLISSGRARTLASGVAIEGSPLEVLIDQTGESEIKIANNNFERETRARNFEFQSNVQKSNASSALFTGVTGAIAPVIRQLGTSA